MFRGEPRSVVKQSKSNTMSKPNKFVQIIS